MYDRTSTYIRVNDARRDLFTRKGRDIEAIPPTSDALRQHAKRSTYQAGYCWLLPPPPSPCPSEWGWVKVAKGALVNDNSSGITELSGAIEMWLQE